MKREQITLPLPAKAPTAKAPIGPKAAPVVKAKAPTVRRSWEPGVKPPHVGPTPQRLAKLKASEQRRVELKAAKASAATLKQAELRVIKDDEAWAQDRYRQDSPFAPANIPAPEMESAIKNIARWRKAPWLFVRDVFKLEPDLWQDEALHALIESGFDKFCMKACKGPGKSCLLAWVIWWFLLCFSHPKVIVTSITESNLNDNLWAELAKWRNKSEMLGALFEYQSSQIYSKDHPDTWFCSPRTWPKDADKTKQAQTLAGLHAQNTLLVLDESGGIPTGVLVAGLAHHSTFDPSGKAKETHLTFIAGNPDDVDSSLGWACTENARDWWVREITGDPDDSKRSPRIDKTWAQKMIDTFGRDNPWVLVNVFGKFPPVGSNKLLGSDQVRHAMEFAPEPQTYEGYDRIMTLDVARSTGRDRSVLGRRQGSVFFPFKIYRLADAVDLAGQVAFEFARWPARAIVVDAVGIGGPVMDHLRSLGLPVVGFQGGLPARDSVRFVDRRTETWWQCAQAIKGTAGIPEVALPSSLGELIAELCAPSLGWTRKGQMKLESKEDMLKRGINSPDIADALTMAFAEPTLLTSETPPSTRAALNARGKCRTEYNPDRESVYADEDES